MAVSVLNPHREEPNSSLQTLITSALRQYGDAAPELADGQLMLMFLDFANEVIEELRHHPYWQDEPLDYYVSLTDARPVPDLIMQHGILAHYAFQQSSQKFGILMSRYHRTMNQILWNRLTGSQRPFMIVPDKRALVPKEIDPNIGARTS